jgi:outer membrane phospholipase A
MFASRRAILATSLVLVFAAFSRAALVLQAPVAPVVAGEEFALVLTETNPGATASVAVAPTSLRLVARDAAGRIAEVAFIPVTVDAVPAVLRPGGFRTMTLRGRLPAEFAGIVVLDAAAAGLGRVAVDTALQSPAAGVAAAQPQTSVSVAADVPATAPAAGASHATALSRSDLGLSPHEPIYFSVGPKGGLNARFQLSFKFRPIGPSDDRIAGERFWEDVYIAFTQTSLWDLHSLSKPFTDSSYRPAAFYHRYDTGVELLGARLGYAAGFEHESNGKGGADSRSINILFARPTLRWGEGDGWQFAASPKLYWYLDKEENDDIQRFRGYGDFLFSLEHPRSLKLSATLRAGTSGHGSILVDATYPFSRINDFLPLGFVHGYLHFQFFDGWGESLLRYDERAETQFRVGFMAVR